MHFFKAACALVSALMLRGDQGGPSISKRAPFVFVVNKPPEAPDRTGRISPNPYNRGPDETQSPLPSLSPPVVPPRPTTEELVEPVQPRVPLLGDEPELQTQPHSPAKSHVIRAPYELELKPFVSIGIKAVRPGPAHNPPPGYRVACPSDRAYCIDYKGSDNGTCMYPDPVSIKNCYDQSCIQSSYGPMVRKQQGEDTYCKDFMTPQGRLCQWIDTAPCKCDSQSIFYYSGEFVPPGEPIPQGFNEVYPCTYPLDLIRKAKEEAALKAKEKRDQKNRKRNGEANKSGKGDDDYDNSSSKSNAQSREERRQRNQQRDSGAGGTTSHETIVTFIGLMVVQLSF